MSDVSDSYGTSSMLSSYLDVILKAKQPDLVVKGQIDANAVAPPCRDLHIYTQRH